MDWEEFHQKKWMHILRNWRINMAVPDRRDLSLENHTVESCSKQVDAWTRICDVVKQQQARQSESLLRQIAQVPIKRSRSATTLGCYVSRNGIPQCIRLQFDQESDLFVDTLLHEVAHLIDHLVSYAGEPYRGAHRSGWQFWAVALGISPSRTGQSKRLAKSYQQRTKLIAVCSGCGEQFFRIRRLNRHRTYVHKHCGSPLKPV